MAQALEDRIIAGAEVEAGGVKIGAAPKLIEVKSGLAALEVDSKATLREGPVLKPRPIYLVHTARRDPALDRAELRYYSIRIYVDADEPLMLETISEVVYHLHETFNEPVRTVRDPRTAFEIQTIAWGEFNVLALVRFKDGRTEALERYLNL